MTNKWQPRSERDLAECIASAALTKTPLAVMGGGTKAEVGRPTTHAAFLMTSGLSGISHYRPTELVISAGAGTPLTDLEQILADKGQMLPFEPMHHGVLLNGVDAPTVGGITAGNVSGPRRIAAGACRDSLIGVRFVNGHGEIIKSGGRVMKNVTGLDLVKLLCGSWGTLAVFSEITFKVLPRPVRSISVVLYGLDDMKAVNALSTALCSPYEVSAAAHLPQSTAEAPKTIIRIEGSSASTTHRAHELVSLWRKFGSAHVKDAETSASLWQSIREVSLLADPANTAIGRLSLAPSKAPVVIARARQKMAFRHFYDWGGGLVWLATEALADAGATHLRASMLGFGGHATLVRAPPSIRAAIDVFEPLSLPMQRLVTRLKSSFDPHRILNPGRMYAGV